MTSVGTASDDPAPPEPSRRQITRERLVDLAAQAFVNEGFANVSVRDLAARTNMTSGAIYGNFAGKSDLLLEVIDTRIHQQLEIFPRAGADHLADVLAEMYESYPDRAEMRALLLEGAVAARGDSEVRQRLHDGQVASLERWAGAYDDLQEQGDIAADLDAQGVLRMLWALELGLGVLEALDLDLPDPMQAARIVGRMVAGLATTDETS